MKARDKMIQTDLMELMKIVGGLFSWSIHRVTAVTKIL